MRSHQNQYLARNEGMQLVVEDETYKVYSTNKLVGGRSQSENKIFVKGEPHYDIEPTVGNSDTIFLKTTYDNRLVGILENGKLEGPSERVKQIHFLGKLNLIPREKQQSSLANGDVVNGAVDEIDVFSDSR